MNEYELTEILAEGSVLAVLIWITTAHIDSEIKRWLYQVPSLLLALSLASPYISDYSIVAFFIELLVLNLLTWRFAPGDRRRARRPGVCASPIPGGYERRKHRRM